jgi:anthranilate phosphoribosyltransferase
MDIGLLLTNLLQISVSAWLAYQRQQGKTEEEIDAMFKVELDKAMAFDPNSIKDV